MKIQSNGISIHVEEQGSGDLALVFLHYWGGSSRTWKYLTEALSEFYRTIAIDHRGWGDSDAPEHGYALADLADDAAGVISALGLGSYVLVGHSMGGKVAQLLASRCSKDVLDELGVHGVHERVVKDGNLITGGGVTAGIDFGLAVLAELRGTDVAKSTQLMLEYDPKPPFDAGSPERAGEGVTATVMAMLGQDLREHAMPAVEAVKRRLATSAAA